MKLVANSSKTLNSPRARALTHTHTKKRQALFACFIRPIRRRQERFLSGARAAEKQKQKQQQHHHHHQQQQQQQQRRRRRRSQECAMTLILASNTCPGSAQTGAALPPGRRKPIWGAFECGRSFAVARLCNSDWTSAPLPPIILHAGSGGLHWGRSRHGGRARAGSRQDV